MQYFNRIGYVTVEDESGAMVSYGGNDSLDFRFSGEKVGNVYTKFSVGILGLSFETINQLTVWNPAESFSRGRKIAVYAGYEDGSIANPLFSGIIIEAIPTNPPEMWLNFKCMNLLGGGDQVSITEQVRDTEIGEVFKYVADELDMDSEWKVDSIDQSKKVDFDFSGLRQNIAEKFADTFGITVFDSNGTLVAMDKRIWLGSKDTDTAVEVSTNTGLLAVGNITLAGATIRKRLDDSSKLMGWINLKSSIVPKANGLYCVIRKRHQGHFRGDEWFTELECIRQGAQV